MPDVRGCCSSMEDRPHTMSCPSYEVPEMTCSAEPAGRFSGWPGHAVYYQLLEEIAKIHAKKNQDYGGHNGDPLSNFKGSERLGVSAFDGCLVRASDKFERVCNLVRKEKVGETAAVVEESIEDNLLDLANYALLAICLRREEA